MNANVTAAPGRPNSEAPHSEAEAVHAQRELGFTPTPLEEGIRKTLDGMGLLKSGQAAAG